MHMQLHQRCHLARTAPRTSLSPIFYGKAREKDINTEPGMAQQLPTGWWLHLSAQQQTLARVSPMVVLSSFAPSAG